MEKLEVIRGYLPAQLAEPKISAEAFAPANIALCKYWGKRNKSLNLPVNASLSVSLGKLGTQTRLEPIDGASDQVWLNGEQLDNSDDFAAKVIDYINLFRSENSPRLKIDTHNSIPTGAGLASSASGFAALIKAIDQLYGFELPTTVLSAFARMGSGSASRSIFEGFVQWHMGHREDGMDSIAEPVDQPWPSLRLGLLTLTEKAKAVGSRAGMQRTTETAHLYQSWPLQAAADLEKLKQAISDQDFETLGKTAEQNALSMHATMIASWPPLLYWQPESVANMQQIWRLREQGLPLYFTMDAGPNIKLLFEDKYQAEVEKQFPAVNVVAPFALSSESNSALPNSTAAESTDSSNKRTGN